MSTVIQPAFSYFNDCLEVGMDETLMPSCKRIAGLYRQSFLFVSDRRDVKMVEGVTSSLTSHVNFTIFDKMELVVDKVSFNSQFGGGST